VSGLSIYSRDYVYMIGIEYTLSGLSIKKELTVFMTGIEYL